MNARKLAELPRRSASSVIPRRTVDISGAIASLIVHEQGPVELLYRLSDPFWFQALGCVLGFDWQASSVTPNVCGALKEAARKFGRDLGVVVCGGKGMSRGKIAEEIRRACERSGDQSEPLIYASRLTAHIDSDCVQDGFDLYHHSFIFVPGGGCWSVIQQGTSGSRRQARRYHWNSGRMPSFVSEPHAAVSCDRQTNVLNLVAGESERHRQAMTALTREHPDRILREVRSFLEGPPTLDGLSGRRKPADGRVLGGTRVRPRDLNPASLKKVLTKTYESQPCDFEELLGEPGLGADALRDLSLLAEAIYQSPSSRRDPAVHQFASGCKAGQLTARHDQTLDRFREVIRAAVIDEPDKAKALKSLDEFGARLRSVHANVTRIKHG